MRSASGRWGFDFEDLVSQLFSDLEYEMVDEDFNISCSNPLHHKQSHEIDFVAHFLGTKIIRSIDSPGERVLVECKLGNVGPLDIQDAQNKAECLNNDGRCGVISGTIIATNSKRGARIRNDTFCWDLRKLSFYASKIFSFKSLQRSGAHIFKEQTLRHFTHTTFIPCFMVGKGVFLFTIFHEDESNPLNKSIINETWETIQATYRNFWGAYPTVETQMEMHSLSGFTRDVKRTTVNIDGISIYVRNALDYSMAPWAVLLRA